ncbi:hypothetical protein KAW48_06350 [candidate division WOR-3 bacterium]|nr:hypothetical protein [candidate division WOR-3 bacterium]
MRIIKGFLLAFIVLTTSVGCEKIYQFTEGKISGINTIESLDKGAVFSFAIMSDNKGDSPEDKKQFANMVQWIEESGDKFIIGVGDHVKKGWDNNFLHFLKENEWWHERFYPNVADGENEFYGKNQGDWGAGAPILDEVALFERSNVSIRENKCEYYAKIKVKGYTVHLIQLHYSDQPKVDSIAFTQDSKQYLMDVLNSIEKGPKDIIIAAAHSRTGFWIEQLSDEQRDVVLDKCDLVLSATTHFFERMIIPGYEDKGPLIINTGSITYPCAYCPYGYVQVHILKKPFTLVVQYINADRPKREIQYQEYAFIKIIGGEILTTNFRKVRPEEDMDRVVGTVPQDFSKEEMDSVVKSIYLEVTDAEEAYISARLGLKEGDITYRKLWDVFPYNNEIYRLTLTAEGVRSIFEKEIPVKGRKEITIAISSYNGDYIIEKLNLPEEKIVKTGKKDIPLLEEWVKGQE